MVKYAVVSVTGGFLFGVMDGLINANPLARRLFEVYSPIARDTINVPAGVAIDLVYGFVMAGVFILLYRSLPGKTGPVKGLSYACLLWFFRVVMYAASQWMILVVSGAAVLYIIATGLVEMIILGFLFGLTLKPTGASDL
jgi:hypothetical protein